VCPPSTEPAASSAVEALADLSAVIFDAFVRLKVRQGQRAHEANSTTAAGKAAVERDGWRCADAGGESSLT
jgi:hypothetical protein